MARPRREALNEFDLKPSRSVFIIRSQTFRRARRAWYICFQARFPLFRRYLAGDSHCRKQVRRIGICAPARRPALAKSASIRGLAPDGGQRNARRGPRGPPDRCVRCSRGRVGARLAEGPDFDLLAIARARAAGSQSPHQFHLPCPAAKVSGSGNRKGAIVRPVGGKS